MSLGILNKLDTGDITGVVPQTYAMNTYAQAYITAVETADGQSLETWYKNAVNRLFIDLLRTGAVSQASLDGFAPNMYIHLFCGARSLAGMLIPLFCESHFTAENFGFVLNDYNRKTGLKANGSNRIQVGGDVPNNSSGSFDYFPSTATSSMCAFCNITETHTDPTQNVLYMSTQTSSTILNSDIFIGQMYSTTTLLTHHGYRVRGGSITNNSTTSINLVSTGLTGARRLLSGSTHFINPWQSKNSSSVNFVNSVSSAHITGNGTFKFFNVPTPSTGFSDGNYRMNLVAFGVTSNQIALTSSLLTFLNTLDQNNF